MNGPLGGDADALRPVKNAAEAFAAKNRDNQGRERQRELCGPSLGNRQRTRFLVASQTWRAGFATA
jgi:hypothetical protein